MHELHGHGMAFKALIEEVSTQMSHEDLRGADGVKRYGQAIRNSVNNYLQGRDLGQRVKGVAFDELILLPT